MNMDNRIRTKKYIFFREISYNSIFGEKLFFFLFHFFEKSTFSQKCWKKYAKVFFRPNSD